MLISVLALLGARDRVGLGNKFAVLAFASAGTKLTCLPKGHPDRRAATTGGRRLPEHDDVDAVMRRAFMPNR